MTDAGTSVDSTSMSTGQESTPAWTSLASRFGLLALLGILMAVLCARMIGAEQFTYINWGDRDLMRASHLDTRVETTGAELSYGNGARIPGGLQYYVMALPMLFTDSPLAVYRFMLLLDTLGVLVLFACIRRTHGTFAALVACGMYLTSQVMWDNMSKLWNPGFLPFFVALAYYFLVRIISDGKVQHFKWAMLCLGIAAQMHFSGVLLMLLFGLVLLRFRPAGLLKQLPLGVVALVLVYAPYLIAEAQNGWQNSRLMFSQYQVVEVSEGTRRHVANWANLRNMFQFFSAEAPTIFDSPRMQQFTRGWANLPYGIFLLFIVVVPWIWFIRHVREGVRASLPPAERVTRALFIIFIVGISYYVYDLSIHLHRGGSGRYLQILLPAYSALAGIVTDRAVSWLKTRGLPVAYSVAVLMVVAALGLQAQSIWHRLFPSSHDGLMAYHRLVATFETLRHETGWTISDIAGRTVVMTFSEDRGGWFWNSANSIDYLIEREDENWRGSLDPPCAILLSGTPERFPETVVDDAFIVQYFDQSIPGFRVLRRIPVSKTGELILYDRTEGRCHCSFSQRYVLTAEEEVMHSVYHTQPIGSAMELPGPGPRTRRFSLMHLPLYTKRLPPRVGILLDVTQSDGSVTVRMHSNQLRGQAYNGDYFSLAMIAHPEVQLVARDTGETTTIPLAHEYVGHKGVLTPVAATAAKVHAGSYFVRFSFEQILDIDQVDWPMDTIERTNISQLICDDFYVD